MGWRIGVLLSGIAVTCAYPQAAVTEVKIRPDPSARVRPLESVVLQVRAYGRLGEQKGRLRRGGAKVKVLDDGGGWVSKPFRFQGADSDEEFLEEFDSKAGQIFGQLTGRFVLQDAVLYTAPERPGSYRVEAEIDGARDTLAIEVDEAMLTLAPDEFHSFPEEPPSLDPYRPLAEHWSPLIAQETWWTPKADYIARFDYDDDWDGDNNWDHLEIGSSQAYLYYTVMETQTHWFLIYNVFHPRDYSDKCVAGSCHENDNEGLILTVFKDGSPHGLLQAMETLAHNNIYSFTADDRVRRAVHNIEGRVEFHEEHHPVVFVESGGHGIYGTRSSHARYDVSSGRFAAGTGVTYIYKGVAEYPRHPDDRLVGYELLSIDAHWWTRAGEAGGDGRTFDDFFTYQPLGNRPPAALARIGGAFLGRAQGRNLAKPFWGWHDNRTKNRNILAVGQWGLDPAYAVSRNLRFPSPFSLTYVHNPYLDVASGRQTAEGREP